MISKKRAKFYKWQEDIIEQGIADAKAIEEMEEYIEQYNDVVMHAHKDLCWKFAFMAIPVALSIATTPLGVPLVVAGATGLVSVAAFAKLERKPKIDAGDCEAAAMLHDVHKNFKWA